MTKRDGGFLVPQKVFNGHLPSFSGNHLPRISLLTKVFASHSIHDNLPFPECNHLPSRAHGLRNEIVAEVIVERRSVSRPELDMALK